MPRHALVICRSNNSGVVCQFSASKSHGSRLQSGREASTVCHYCATGELQNALEPDQENGLQYTVLLGTKARSPKQSIPRRHACERRNERARGLTDFVSRYVISRTRTVHNSLPDCRGFKTRATRSKRGIEIGIGSALLHFHLHRGRSRAVIYRMTTTSMCVKRSRAAAAAARTAGPIMMAAAVALFFRRRTSIIPFPLCVAAYECRL